MQTKMLMLKMIFIVALLAVFPCAAQADEAYFEKCDPKPYGLEKCPNDIDHFLSSLNECNHWAGEEPYDAARRVEIEKNRADLGCGIMACEYMDLLRKYKGEQNHLHLIQDNLNLITGEDPAHYAAGCLTH